MLSFVDVPLQLARQTNKKKRGLDKRPLDNQEVLAEELEKGFDEKASRLWCHLVTCILKQAIITLQEMAVL